MTNPQSKEASPFSYIVVLTGTHVTGKETIAVSLAKSLNCPWLKGEGLHNAAGSAARSQAKRGADYSAVFGRAWFTRMQRIGLMPGGEVEPNGSLDGSEARPRCVAFISCYALRRPARDGIRQVMRARSVRVVFVVLQITAEVLSGRTLGAEEPDLAERIMKEKREDLREPMEEETDVLVVDSMQDVDSLTSDIEDRIRRQVADMESKGFT